MNTVYYSSSNTERDGRASHFFLSQEKAQTIVTDQNARAEALGIKARYTLVETVDTGIDRKNIR